MLELIDRYHEGHTCVPLILLGREEGLFSQLAGHDEGKKVERLTEVLSIQPACLDLVLRILKSLHWIRWDESDVVRLTEKGLQQEGIPADLLDLYDLDWLALCRGGEVPSGLYDFLERSARGWHIEDDFLRDFVDGCLAIPLLHTLESISLRRLPGNVPHGPSLGRRLDERIEEWMIRKTWIRPHQDQVELTENGRLMVERCRTLGTTVSYTPLLKNPEGLIDPQYLKNQDLVYSRRHANLTLDRLAKEVRTEAYNEELVRLIALLFDKGPFEEQPEFLLDPACGSGAFLKRVYGIIRDQTARGEALERYPLKLIAVGHQVSESEEMSRNLSGLPHLILTGNSTHSRRLLDELREHGVSDGEGILCLHASPVFEETSCSPGDIATQSAERFFQENDGWTSISRKQGLILMTVHGSSAEPPGPRFHTELLGRWSSKALPNAEQHLIRAANAGFFPRSQPFHQSESPALCRASLSHFEKRPYKVRPAEMGDLDALERLERLCWGEALATATEQLAERIIHYPEGHFVLEEEGAVVGVIYSQRIADRDDLFTTNALDVSMLHRRDGVIVQLLAVNIDPAMQGRQWGDQLLEFMLQRCSVMSGITTVVGVTRCRDYCKQSLSMEEYVSRKDDQNLLIDPILRFHDRHGARVVGPIPGYRPRDQSNEGFGVLVEYDIQNRERREVRIEEYPEHSNDAPGSLLPSTTRLRHSMLNGASVENTLEELIKGLLGASNADAFDRERPLMEMGLDSADLLTLSEQVSVKFRERLDPAFFFQYSTLERIRLYFEGEAESSVGSPVEIPTTGREETVALEESCDDIPSRESDVAITGMACRLPGGIHTPEALWRLVKDGSSVVGSLPAGRWRWPHGIDPETTHPGIDRGGFLEDIEYFDPHFFRLSPMEAELIDPQQRLLLELSWEVLEDAGYSSRDLSGSKTGVYIGASGSDYRLLIEQIGIEPEAHMGTGNAMSILANRISYFHNFVGPSLSIDTACSSSLVAVHEAVEALQSGKCSQAMVGGVNLMCHPATTISSYKAGMLSADGNCKTFDASANGYVRSEGAVMLILKPLKQALADGDTVHALIKGTACNHGGRASGLTVPNPEQQARLLKDAWEAARIDPRSIGYIEAHGTGTKLGDPIEVLGLKQAFSDEGKSKTRANSCALGSIKTNLGHLEAAAGIAGVINAVLSLKHRAFPATVHFTELNSQCQLTDSPFHIVQKYQAWPENLLEQGRSIPRRAGISSFGFGGANAHAVLEEYRSGPLASPVSPPPYLLVLSARNRNRLQAYARKLTDFLDARDDQADAPGYLASFVHTLQRREPMEERLAFVVHSLGEAMENLSRVAKQTPFEGARSGSVKEGRELAGFIHSHEAMEEVFSTWLKDRELEKVAELWVKGVPVRDWALLYENPPPIIRLPTYPFAREKCWVQMREAPVADERSGGVKNRHPFLQEETSTVSEKRFSSKFTGKEFFLADHRVKGEKMFPGVAYLEMARAGIAASRGTGQRNATALLLKDVVWVRPIIVAADPEDVHLRLYPEANGEIRYEIYTRKPGGGEDVVAHAHGSGMFVTADLPPRLNLESLRNACRAEPLDADKCYADLGAMGLDYGPGHRGVEQVWVGPDQRLAKLSLPPCVADTHEHFMLHPSIMDGAIQASLDLVTANGGGETVLPFALASVEIFKRCPARAWALVRYADGNGKDALTRKLDVDICDEAGNICVRLGGFSVRVLARSVAVERPEAPTATPLSESAVGLVMMSPEWVAVSPPEKKVPVPSQSDQVVIAGGTEAQRRELQNTYPSAQLLTFHADDTIEKMQSRLAAASTVEHLIWIAPDGHLKDLTDEAFIEERQTGVLQLFRLAKAMLASGYGTRDLAWTVLTTQTLSVRQNEDVNPLHAGVHGLVGSMAREFSHWKVRVVDLDAGSDRPIEALFSLPADGRGDALAYRGGEWFQQTLVPIRKQTEGLPGYRENGVYVVIGGAGGLGEVWSQFMIAQFQARIVWVGRSAWNETMQARLDRLAEHGPAPSYIQADATNRDALQKALDQIKQTHSEIHGVIHSAIVLHDASLMSMDETAFLTGFSAKVDVSVRLAQVFAQEPLDFLLFFSSILSFTRTPGQSNYAAGCTFKDSYALQLGRERSCPVKLINWGYWGSVGIVADPLYRERMERTGIGSIEPEEGLAALAYLLHGPFDRIAVVKTLRPGAMEGLSGVEWMTTAPDAPDCFRRLEKPLIPSGEAVEVSDLSGGLKNRAMERLLLRILWGSLQALSSSETGSLELPSARTERIDLYARWFEESLRILQKELNLDHDPESDTLTGPEVDLKATWEEWKEEKKTWLKTYGHKSQVVLAESVLRVLPDILTGKTQATEIMFPNASMERVEGIYKDNPAADYFNRRLGDGVVAYIEERLARDPSVAIRILEVGAGTGGTTSSLLPRLRQFQGTIEEYRFTDLSKAFLMYAEEAFAPSYPFLRTQIFDVSKPLEGQKIQISRYDIVIATNVLHATRNVRVSLRNVKAALGKNGLLALNELSEFSLFTHLTFGLLEGWWLYEDPALRLSGSPGLSTESWSSVLADEGFEAILFPARSAHGAGQQIILAQSDGLIRQQRPETTKMRAGETGLETEPITAPCGPLRTSKGPTPISGAPSVTDRMVEDHVRSLLRQCIADALMMAEREILDDRSFSEIGVDSIIAVQLVNRINKAGRILLQTTVLFDYNNVDRLTQHLIDEHDLALRASLQESGSPVEEVAPVARWEEPPLSQAIIPPDDQDQYHRVLIEGPGKIDDLRIVATRQPLLEPGEVRISVRAFSLNFADLLCVKGLYPTMPPYPFSPGLEVSGVVVEVGDSVTGLRRGDAVIGMMGEFMGGHATMVTCREDQVFAKPARLSFEEACALPTVAFTMIDAFGKADLQPGERVLIQTAAGGTGLIAVQLAQQAGAEIFATAGSQHKLEYLRALGVPNLINYQEADFESEIRRLTEGQGVDVVVNTLPGEAIQKGMNCLSPGGRYVEIAMTALKSATTIDLSVLDSNQSFYSIDLRKLGSHDPQKLVAYRAEMIQLLEEGAVAPTVCEVFPFDQVKEAYRSLENRSNIGKMVVTVPELHSETTISSRTPVARARETSPTMEPIAIVGMSGRFAKSDDLNAFWDHLSRGTDLVEEVSRWELSIHDASSVTNDAYCQRGSFLESIDRFDPLFFQISGLEARYMDPQQRLFLEESWKALEDAGYAGESIRERRCGIYVGCAAGDYSKLLSDDSPAQAFWGNAGSVIPARIAYYLDLQGPAVAVDTACSSSLVAIHLACQSLWTGETEMALAGGVFVQCTPDFFRSANRAGMLSPTGSCHTFDDRADGFVPGEGVGVVVLKRLSEAIADGDHIDGVIRGSGVNQDGATNGITAPSAKSQERLEREVYERFQIHPETIRMVEAHGTGTALGDPIEFAALQNAFRRDTDNTGYCALGSVKTNIGHAAMAAGVAGFIKILLSMKHKAIPPSLHYEKANRAIDLVGSPFYLNTKLCSWDEAESGPRRAAISSFGFSGTNAHMVIEEAPMVDRRHAEKPGYLMVLSAQTSEQLRRQAENLLTFCKEDGAVDAGNMSYTLLMGRSHWNHRLACVVRSGDEWIALLEQWLEKGKHLSVYVAELKDGEYREQATLKSYGNRLIEDGQSGLHGSGYLEHLETLAELYIQGYGLNYGNLFEGGYQRVSLPAYPFARERYWIEESSSSLNDMRVKGGFHALVHEDTSVFGRQRFSSTFTGEEFFLADHMVNGRKILPGVAYLEMALAAVEQAAGSAAERRLDIQLKSVVWTRPLAVSGPAQDVHIALFPTEHGEVQYEIYTGSLDEKESEVIHHQGVAFFGSPERMAPLDLPKLREMCNRNRLKANEFYENFESTGIAYGPGHQGIEEVYVGADQILAKLSFPPSVADSQHQYLLHPSLMDSALQASLGLILDPALHRPVLPFALESLEVFTPCRTSGWTLIRRSEGCRAEDRVQKVDLDLCDEVGNVCVRMAGLTFRVLERDVSGGEKASLFLAQPVWKEEAVRESPSPPDFSRHLVMLGGADHGEVDIETRNSETSWLTLPAKQKGIAHRYQACVTLVLEQIQTILQDQSKGKILMQLVISSRGENRLLAGLSGLLKTAHLENPRFHGQLIEIDAEDIGAWGQGLLERIEADSRAPETVHIRYQNGKRTVSSWEEVPRSSREINLPWREGGVYLLTGGAGGLGQIFAREIASKVQNTRLILTGRSAHDEQKGEALKALKALGAQVVYRRVDVADQKAVERLMTGIREEFGRLDGIIHGAGIIKDNFILKKTKQELTEVLAPKVSGLVNLDQASRSFALDFLVLFSSSAGAMGNPGQADYAAANAFMDAYAVYRNELVAGNQRRGQTLSINWSWWKEGGMTMDEVTLTTMRENLGLMGLETAFGLAGFYQALASGQPQMMVLAGALHQLRAALFRDGSAAGRGLAEPAERADLPAAGVPAGLEKKTLDYLRNELCSILKLPPHRIQPEVRLEKYGIDSIMVTRLTNKLEKTFGPLSKTLFFEYQTIQEVVGYFLDSYRERLVEILQIEREETRGEPTVPKPDRPLERLRGEPPRLRMDPASDRVGKTEVPEALTDVAIIGMSGRYPQAENLDVYWENLREGRDCITEVPEDRWDWRQFYSKNEDQAGAHASKWGGFLDDVDKFDPLFFNISPREAQRMDPQERLFLECAWKTVEDAGYTRSGLKPFRTGVYVGVMYGQYQFFGVEASMQGQPIAASSSYASIANRVSYFMNFNGPSLAVDTMCCSSLSAIHLACQSLKNGESELALAGGVNLTLHPDKYTYLSQGQFMSSEGQCRSFGRGGDGYVPGEGVGALLLKPLSSAREDGDFVYGVIKGTSLNHDGRTNGYTVPNPNAQAALIRHAMEQAGVDPEGISYIEAHGTGTSLGDPVEIAGLSKAFARSGRRNVCAIGSVKSNIGHLESAAGIAGVTKVILQMQHEQLVPSLHASPANPNIDFEQTPFQIQHELADWERPLVGENGNGVALPRRAGVSSFGAGGSNAHLVLEEYERPQVASSLEEQPQLIVLSAKDEERLNVYAATLLAFLKKRGETVSFVDLAYTLQVGREALTERLAVVATRMSELITTLEKFCQGNVEVGQLYRGSEKLGQRHLGIMLKGRTTEALVNMLVEQKIWDELAPLWVVGVEVDWNRIRSDHEANRLPLPTYPFARERYWIGQNQSLQPGQPVKQNLTLHGTRDVDDSANHSSRETSQARRVRQPALTPRALVGAVRSWLLGLLSTELNIDPVKVELDTPFQDYGVDSVLLAQLVGKIDQKLTEPLDPSILYEYPTLESMAGWLVDTHATALTEAFELGAEPPSPLPDAVPGPVPQAKLQPAPSAEQPAFSGIAVVGLSCRFPGAKDVEEYWQILSEGRSAITQVPPERWANPGRFNAGLIDTITCFDPAYFLIPEEDARAMDPQALLVLEESLKLFCHAGYSLDEVKGTAMGVYLGGRSRHHPEAGELQRARNPIVAAGQNYLAANISQFFDLRGASLVIDTACSSALVGMNSAISSLRRGEIEAALVGGVNLLPNDEVHQIFQQRNLLSPDPAFHLFDQRASGVVPGEGVGMVLLKTVEQARKDGDHIYAVIKGLAINNDGRTAGPATPNIEAQKQVMRTALARSGRSPDEIGHIEANGSGSEVTDLLELKAIESIYRSSSKAPCSLGSVKPNIGHPLCAEGIAGFIKLVLMLSHRQGVPFLSGRQAMTHYDMATSAFSFARESSPWGGAPRIAALNSFADGGTNAHLIVEGWEGPEGQSVGRRPLTPPELNRVNLKNVLPRRVAL